MCRTRLLLPSALILLAAACTPASSPATDAALPVAGAQTPAASATPEVLPPARTVGENWELPVLPGTRSDWEQRFGKANLQEQVRSGPEGDGQYPVLVLFPQDPARRLELMPDAGHPDAPLQGVRVSDEGSLWHDGNGLRMGMSLAELVTLNAAPIDFSGLDWDYGGLVQDWHAGHLDNPADTPRFHSVTLVARPDADAALPVGDAAYRSDDPAWPGIGRNLVVGEIGINWPGEEP